MTKTKRVRKPVAKAEIIEALKPLAVPIDSIVPDPDNLRKHSEDNLEGLERSLRRFGQRLPLVVQKDTNIIRVGNGRWQVAKERLGWDEVAVVFVEETDDESIAYAVADNRLGSWANGTTKTYQVCSSNLANRSPTMMTCLLVGRTSTWTPS